MVFQGIGFMGSRLQVQRVRASGLKGCRVWDFRLWEPGLRQSRCLHNSKVLGSGLLL